MLSQAYQASLSPSLSRIKRGNIKNRGTLIRSPTTRKSILKLTNHEHERRRNRENFYRKNIAAESKRQHQTEESEGQHQTEESERQHPIKHPALATRENYLTKYRTPIALISTLALLFICKKDNQSILNIERIKLDRS